MNFRDLFKLHFKSCVSWVLWFSYILVEWPDSPLRLPTQAADVDWERRTGQNRTVALKIGLFRQKFPFVTGSLSLSMALRGMQKMSSWVMWLLIWEVNLMREDSLKQKYSTGKVSSVPTEIRRLLWVQKGRETLLVGRSVEVLPLHRSRVSTGENEGDGNRAYWLWVGGVGRQEDEGPVRETTVLCDR